MYEHTEGNSSFMTSHLWDLGIDILWDATSAGFAVRDCVWDTLTLSLINN